MKTFIELVKKNRSFRSFDNTRRVTYEDLSDFIEAARFTPSSTNLQPLKFITSDKDATNTVIRSYTKWAGLLKNYDGPKENENPTAYIIICIDTTITSNIEAFNRDVGISAQTVMLAAAEKDIGGCMIGSFDAKRIAAELDLPENLVPRLVLALGYPKEEVVIEDCNGNNTAYYRDELNIHHVPKRLKKDIIYKL